MSSTIYEADHLAPVINLTAARAARDERGSADVGATLLVRCALVSDDAVYRWVGIHEHTTIDECRRVIATVFAIDGEVAAEADGALELREVLRAPGEATSFTWGLWRIAAQLADVYPRDESTPPSVCVAGVGRFGGTPFNIGEVNAQLLGSEQVAGLTELVRDDARAVLRRAHTHDFLPLIRALGVNRDTGPLPVDRRVLAELPREVEPKARDAFWATVLADACCAAPDVTCDISESIMRSLGWEGVGAAEMTRLAAESLGELEALAVDASVPERLDIYRDLLRG